MRGEVAFLLLQMAFSVCLHATIMRGMAFVSWLMHINNGGRRDTAIPRSRRCIYVWRRSLVSR